MRKTLLISILAVMLAVGGVFAYDGVANIIVEKGYFGTQPEEGELGGLVQFGAPDFPDGIRVDGTYVIDTSGNIDAPVTTTDVTTSDDLVVGDDVDVTGNIVVDGNVLITPGNITATTTLTTSSANEQFLRASAVQETITLPAAANATGTRFMFRVAGALTGVTVQITSAEKDNISGTLIVAGAVVDCRAEDYINIITDGEVIGDYVEFISLGYEGWLIGDSGVLTTGKMTCTDPS